VSQLAFTLLIKSHSVSRVAGLRRGLIDWAIGMKSLAAGNECRKAREKLPVAAGLIA